MCKWLVQALPLEYDGSDMKRNEQDWLAERQRMVQQQLLHRGISDQRLLDAMLTVARERFVEDACQNSSYADGPLPIGYGQTISQPYIVAYMCQLLAVEKTHRVLEIGCGSGYQAAILAKLADFVVAVERVEELYERALKVLTAELDSGKIRLFWGDGALGVPELAPFDRIIVSAAIKGTNPPLALMDQLAPEGIMVAPMGNFEQNIHIFIKKEGGIERYQGLAVSFVPFISDAN